MPVLTAHVFDPLALAASVTVSVTSRVPCVAYLRLTVTPLPVVPSPNVHAYETIPVSSVEDEPLKLHVRPFTLLVQSQEYLATGNTFPGGGGGGGGGAPAPMNAV